MSWGPDELAAANAALRLGDWAVPPAGSWVRTPRRPLSAPSYYVIGHASDNAEAFVAARYDTGTEVWLSRPDAMVLVAVPDFAPPFEEWPRPGREP